MEGKKKFEKPELQVVEMKLAGVTCGSGSGSCDEEEHQQGCMCDDDV
jgi:hypothetical protein